MPRATIVLKVDPQEPDLAVLDRAAGVLRDGGLVAFATETVYGLGADATNPDAVARIFEAKGRPSFNPLIVHAESAAMARTCVAAWPSTAEILAARFWPGPLTLVLPRSSSISDVVTAGLETVGVRVPVPPVARGLIARAGRPLAAPSANRSNRLSPTLAAHVLEDLEGRVDMVLDSGPTAVGIESTVLDLTATPPRVLRPGPITASALAQALGGVSVGEPPVVRSESAPLSPGQLAVHYAPRTRAVRITDVSDLARIARPETVALVIVGEHVVESLRGFARTIALAEPTDAARALYGALHECDRACVARIVVLLPPERSEWRAVRDRLMRATEPIGDLDLLAD